MKTCSTCEFFKAEESTCRRYPPTAMMYPQREKPRLEGGKLIAGGVGVQLGSTFAPTLSDEWCGEHRPAIAVDETEAKPRAEHLQ